MNSYNGITYYFIQYHDKNNLPKRGWIDASLGVVTYTTSSGLSVLNNSSHNYFMIVNKNTGKALAWNSITNVLNLQNAEASSSQLFKIEKTYYNGSYTGYYPIVPFSNSQKALRVSGTGFSEGLSIYMDDRGDIDKRQEFFFKLWYDDNDSTETKDWVYHVSMESRSTGNYRAVEESNDKLIQSVSDYYSHQLWELVRVNRPWDGYFNLYDGDAYPYNYKVYIDVSVPSTFSVSEIQACVDAWTDQSDDFSIQVIRGSGTASNRFATITNQTIQETTVWGRTCPEFRNNNNELEPEPYPSEGQLNSAWHSITIQVDFEKVANRFSSDAEYENAMLDLITHELGHAFKLSHTFSKLKRPNVESNVGWDEVDFSTAIMNPHVEYFGDGSITWIDSRRFYDKWIVAT